MDCSRYGQYLIRWASGDRILLSCVNGGTVRVSRVDNTTLPKDLPAGFEYAFAFAIEVSQNGIPLDVVPEGGFIKIGFASRHENPQYGITYWGDMDADWISLKDFQTSASGAPMSFPLHPSNPQDAYRVLSGAQFKMDGDLPREEVTTNFPGIFALVQR